MCCRISADGVSACAVVHIRAVKLYTQLRVAVSVLELSVLFSARVSLLYAPRLLWCHRCHQSVAECQSERVAPPQGPAGAGHVFTSRHKTSHNDAKITQKSDANVII